MGKTGSTALAYFLQRNLPGHKMAFEPGKLDVVPDNPNLVCKYFLKRSDYGHPRLSTYDRIVLLVRHPFDTLVIRYIVKVVSDSRARWRLPAFQPGIVALRDPGGHLGRAVVAYRHRRIADVHLELAAAESAGVRLPAMHYLRGCVYRLEKRFDLASTEFGRLLESHADDHEGLMLLSRSHLSAGRSRQALVAAERAIAFNASQKEGYVIASQAYRKLGLKEQAREAARKALDSSLGDTPNSSRRSAKGDAIMMRNFCASQK